MIRGLYTAASGMLTAARRMQVVTDNLANAETPGFKQSLTATGSFADQLIQQLAAQPGARQIGQHTLASIAEQPDLDLSQGPIETTGRALDLALQGSGFFAVQTPDGVRYTRDGGFSRDALGQLVTTTGAVVLGEGGPLQIPDGPLTIRPDGTVEVNGAPAGRIMFVEFPAGTPLEKVGRNELNPIDGTAPTPALATTVRQGAIERSNVNVTTALTTSLELQRAYEASQRMIQQQDELVGRAVTEIARPVS